MTQPYYTVYRLRMSGYTKARLAAATDSALADALPPPLPDPLKKKNGMGPPEGAHGTKDRFPWELQEK